MQNIVVLSGAGISAESGLKTFRDSDGLWEGHNVEEVATPQAFVKNPQLVLDFYNARRRAILQANPNKAHIGIAELQTKYQVTVITQNIDDLHERAGSQNVLHLHGEIFKMRSVKNYNHVYDIREDIQLGDVAPDGGQLRPHIVWFGEAVPAMELAIPIVKQADALIVVGTSLMVYPAAGLVNETLGNTPIYVLDKKIPRGLPKRIIPIEKSAVEGIDDLLSYFL